MERSKKREIKASGKTVSLNVATALIAAFLLFAFAGESFAKTGLCERSARYALNGCIYDARETLWIDFGKCSNIADIEERRECEESIKAEYYESKDSCEEQYTARLDVCDQIGSGPYQPEIDPSGFIDPETENMAYLNPFFPLVPGNVWVYEAMTDEGLETITVTVTDEIKDIEYPEDSGQIFKCRVVRDVVTVEDVLVEDTVDWYATDLDANLWYFGEIAKNYEEGELTDLDGSWKAGREGAVPGIVLYSAPSLGDVYRQEFLLGEAEDMAEVVSVGTDSVTVPAGEFSDDILKTEEWTPVEPDVLEYKYYAPGVGMVLEVNPETGERVELVEMPASTTLP